MRPRVLIVEDDLQTREALRQVLEREGCEIDLATDGQKAIGCLAQHRYDVILLDIVLPKISGTEVMEYIASTTPEQLEFVIVVTGLEVGEIRKLFPSVRDALAKPVMPTRLLASVRRVLAPRDSRQSGASVA
ncbi:MAG TPA: response regulator [Thermoanaerobaculia bacterium]|jgi:CheY-like chemotaxis protein